MQPAFGPRVTLPHALAGVADRHPDTVVVEEVDGRAATAAALHVESLTWAGALRDLGVDVGHTVLTMLPNGITSYAVWLGASWLRAMEVPVNTMFRGQLFRHVVNDSRASVAVVHERYLEQLRDVATDLTFLDTVVVVGGTSPTRLPFRTLAADGLLADVKPPTDLAGPEYYDTSSIIYTSGTTGPSKGVLMPWRELYEFPASLPDGSCTPGRGQYIVLPVFHVSGKQALWAAVLYGSRLVVREVFSVTEFWADVKRYDCTSTGLIGVMASLLLRTPEHPDESDSPLRNVTMGPVIPEVEEFCLRFNVRVSTGYGMTEVAVPLGSDGFNVSAANWQSCGRPRPGYQLRVVNDHDEPLGPDQVGELIVRTDEPWVLNAGYWQLPDATAEAWRNGWFHTGDGFRYDDDGNYYFVDRIKDAIRRRGENISSFEVEAYVGEHPDVMESAAIAVPADVTEDDVKVIVVAKPGATLTPEALFDFLLPRMPRFMLPRYIEIVDELPKTPTLRTRKVALRDQARNARTWDREAAGVTIPPTS